MKNPALAALMIFSATVAVSLSVKAIEPGRNSEGEFCASAPDLMHKANELFGEKVQWTGKSKDGFRYVLMTSDHTWTFIMIDNKTDSDGDLQACIKASDGNPAPSAGDNP